MCPSAVLVRTTSQSLGLIKYRHKAPHLIGCTTALSDLTRFTLARGRDTGAYEVAGKRWGLAHGGSPNVRVGERMRQRGRRPLGDVDSWNAGVDSLHVDAPRDMS